VVSFTPRPFYFQRKSPCYPLDRRLGGPQSLSGRGGEEKNSQPLPTFEPPIIQPLVQCCTTELSRLLYICIYMSMYVGMYVLITITHGPVLMFALIRCACFTVSFLPTVIFCSDSEGFYHSSRLFWGKETFPQQSSLLTSFIMELCIV
jgi:hypothetical protein